MSRPAQWVLAWPLSDGGPRPDGVVQARCGQLVAMVATRFRAVTRSDVPTLRVDLSCRVRGSQVRSAGRWPPVTVGHSDHRDWLALLRVRSGRVSKRDDDRYLYRGAPFPDVSLVAVALHRLQQAGMVTLTEPDEHGLATVVLTEAGLARYQELIERQRARPDP